MICDGQNTTKQQFQINLVSFSDPIDVLLVNKDSDADKPSVTFVPPPKHESSSATQEVPRRSELTSYTDNAVTMTTASEAAENKDMAVSQSSSTVQWPGSRVLQVLTYGE